ncbi:MAG: type II toxin-antitoxin system prevent-host-death family antitoxin [bacterium]
MKEVSYSEARQNFANILSIVCKDQIPVYINRKNGERAVIISVSEYESMDETAYLIRSEANKKHLQKSIQQARNGKVFPLNKLTK